jgi:hypothetical protein
MQRTHFAQLGTPHFGFRSFNGREDLACTVEQVFTRLSQKHVALIPIKQTGAHFLFERADLNTQRRLSDVQTRGRASKAQFLRDGDKIT